jgi:hypothetical protein
MLHADQLTPTQIESLRAKQQHIVEQYKILFEEDIKKRKDLKETSDKDKNNA